MGCRKLGLLLNMCWQTFMHGLKLIQRFHILMLLLLPPLHQEEIQVLLVVDDNLYSDEYLRVLATN